MECKEATKITNNQTVKEFSDSGFQEWTSPEKQTNQ